MPIGDYCRSEPTTARPDESVQDAAKRMDAAGVGCVVVVDELSKPVGLLTDRDVALHVLRHRVDPARATVAELMREPVVTLSERAPIAVAARFMRQHGLRRIPVVDNETGVLTGIVAADDLLQLVSAELAVAVDVARQQFPADLRGERALAPGSGGA
jgi:CBS domain-containing protein